MLIFMFKKKEKFWINIDIPTKKFTLHHSCYYTEKMTETPNKGVGNLKKDGGWLQMNSLKEAENLFIDCYSHFTFIRHC